MRIKTMWKRSFEKIGGAPKHRHPTTIATTAAF